MGNVHGLVAMALLVSLVTPCVMGADDAGAARAEGNAAFLRGDVDMAVRRYTDAIRLDPHDAAACNNRGYARLWKGDTLGAIADYDEALRLDPNYAKAHFFRGSAYEEEGEQDKAVDDYTAAIRLDAKYARSYCSRGATAKAPAVFTDGPPRRTQETGDIHGEVFFVAPDGDDNNPGTIQRPFATLYKAHQRVRPGDTINLRAGTYPALISWKKGGTPTAPITVQTYNGEDVRLQSSEQYAWTRVADPTFGDCWKAAIPYRRIRYPGMQHTIWEDAVNAERNPHVGIVAIVKGGYMCASMNSAADFAKPGSARGLPLIDKSGNLKYDITWYDRRAKALWFKPGPSRVDDPSRQLYVTSTTCGQFSLEGSYVKLHGLKFEYLHYFHQQGSTTGCEMNDCEIKHAGGGFCGGGARCAYTSLLVDKIGDWLTWRNGGYDRGYLSHCFYFNGTRCIISNCFFGRSNKGGPIQNYPDGVAENVFDGNVLYHSDGGSIFMGSGKNYVTNNISLQETYGMGPYVSMQGFTFAHNYSEAVDPFTFSCQAAAGIYTGTFQRFAITGNVLNNAGGCVGYEGNIVDARQCKIDGNVYLGSSRWRVGLTQADPPLAGQKEYASFASYAAALQALPGCAAWEKKSLAGAAARRFDFAAMDALLDTDPPLTAVLAKARQYVRDVTAAFPAAGPARP